MRRRKSELLKIAICGHNPDRVVAMRDMIQDYLIEKHSLAKVALFNTSQAMIDVIQMFDIYFLDVDMPEINGIEIANILREQGDEVGRIIFAGSAAEQALTAYNANAFAFLLKPVDKEQLFPILDKVRNDIKKNSVIITTPNGERRIHTDNLNYVNIVKRCLCYHLRDGSLFDGQTLRGSFEKAITPLNTHPEFVFLAPSLLINLTQIKILDKDCLIFDNDDVLYFPRKQYDYLRSRWLNYHIVE